MPMNAHRPTAMRCAALVFAALSFESGAAAQRLPSEKAVLEFERERTEVLAEAGQRHLRLGSWARKLGLVQQATVEFLRAQEVAEGSNPGADYVVNLMRSLDDRFWSSRRENPARRLLQQYEHKAKDLDKRDRRDRLKLAELALRKRLDDHADALYRALLRDHDGPLERDDKGRIELAEGFVPAEVAARIAGQSVKIDGKERVRDTFLAKIPELGEVFEHASDALSVRSQNSAAEAERLHRLLTAALPHLEEAVGGIPTRQLRVFVFRDRAGFEGYLAAADYGESHADGLMDPMEFVALVCADGRPPATVDAVALHELTHLFDFAVSPVVFPAWYAEAFAESFGGIGTFHCDGDKLSVGGDLEGWRLDPLRDPTKLFPLREMLELHPMTLLRTDPERAAVFYAQAWAFLRYLRKEAGGEVADKLRTWELRCRGAAIGAVAGDRQRRDTQSAATLFEQAFGRQFDELEAGFKAWLAVR
jgi:hypothetical protein